MGRRGAAGRGWRMRLVGVVRAGAARRAGQGRAAKQWRWAAGALAEAGMAVVGREDEGDGEARRGWCRAARENPDGSSSAKARWSQASCYSYNWASPPHARSRRERGLTVGGWTAVPGAGEWRAAVRLAPLARPLRWRGSERCEELRRSEDGTGVPFLRVTPVVVALFRKWTATWVFKGQLITFHFGRGQLRYGVVLHTTCSTTAQVVYGVTFFGGSSIVT